MRSTTKALAALAAISATLAMGVSSASALQWSYPGGAKLEGTLTLDLGNTGRTATCANLVASVGLTNTYPTVAQWSTGLLQEVNCVDDQTGQATKLPLYYWMGWGVQAGGGLQLQGSQFTGSWANGPFSQQGFRNYPAGNLAFDLINGNATTPTKIVFDDDQIGFNAYNTQAIRATGELTLRPFLAGFPGYTGPTLVTLN